MSSSTQSRSSRKDYNRGHENSANSNATSTTSSGKRRYYEDDTNDEGHYTMYAKPQQQRETNSSTRGGGAGGARYDGSNIKNNYYQRGRSNASAAGGSGGGPRSHSNNSTAPNTPNLTYQQQPPLQQQGGGGGSLRPGGAYSGGRRPLLSHNSHGGTSMSGAASSGGQYYRDAHQQATSYAGNRGGHLNSGGGGGAAVVAVPTSSTTQHRFRSLSDGSWWYRNDPYSGNRRSASSEAGQRPTTSPSSTKSSTNYCRHYLQGQCNRGAMCRFTHLEQHSVVIRSSKTPQGLRARSSSPVPPQDHIISGSGGSGGFQDSDMIASLSNFQEEDPYHHENHHIMADHGSGGGCCTPNSSEPAYFSLITNHSHSSAFPFTAPPLTPSLESSPSNSFVHDPYGQYNQQQLFYGGHHNQENGYYGCGSSPASSTTKNAAVVSFPAAPPSNIRVNQPYNNQNQHLYHLSEEVQDEPTTTTAASPTDVPPFMGDDVTMSSDGHEPTTHSDEGASMGLARNETDMYLDEYEALQPGQGQGQGQQPEHAPLESRVAPHHHHSQSRPLVDHRSYVYEVAQPPLVPAVQQPPVSSRDGGELPDSGVAVAADDDASVATDISLHPSPSLAPSCQPSLFSGFPPGWDDEMDGMFQLPPTSTYHHHQPQQQQQQQHAVVAGLPYASNARFVSGWAAAPEGSSTTWRRQEHYAAALSTTNSNGRFSGELASSSEQHSPQFGYRSSNSAHHLPPLTPEDELKLKTLW